jgi:acetyl-CoA synthetase
VVVRQPWPGMLLTIYHNPERYQHAYWDRYPGVFTTGDYATRDEDGYIWFLGRADEVLKVAGHRIGTAEVESAAVSHPAVAEAAVVGREDPIKGVAVVMFAILMEGHAPSEALVEELRKHVRATIGPVATPESILFMNSLPKTRSGKIMRRVLASVASGKAVGDVTTLEEEASVGEVQQAYAELREQLAPEP